MTRRHVTLSRTLLAIVVGTILACIVLGLLHVLPIPQTAPAQDEPTTAQPTTQESQPATQPEEAWQPPRFDARQDDRDRMARVIRRYGLVDPTILKAMAAVPRHEFVPKDYQRRAYADTPLPIGFGQTISQPYIVAEMTRQLNLTAKSRVLEIGTGSGYQAAVLTELTPRVYTIEIVGPLAGAAATRFERLGYDVIQARHGDGYYGWEEAAPFDAIIVTAAAAQVPPPLLKQLAPGGRMIIPIGGPMAVQSLTVIDKAEDGTVRSRSIMAVRFVPFLRKDPAAE